MYANYWIKTKLALKNDVEKVLGDVLKPINP